jgi:hypothetical protein
MSNKIYDIDCMKYRKSTHLAGVDVETIISEKGNCIVTIKEAYFAKNIDVSGNKTDGYFLEFVEDLKPMLVNSINRKTIASVVKINTGCTSTESRNIGNWVGTKLDLYFDPSVKMMGQIVGGIRVKPQSPIIQVDDKKAIDVLNQSKTLNELKENWSKLSKNEQAFPSVVKCKEDLKAKLS